MEVPGGFGRGPGVVAFSEVGRPLRPPRRGAAAGGAVLFEKNQRQINPRTAPEPQLSRNLN